MKRATNVKITSLTLALLVGLLLTLSIRTSGGRHAAQARSIVTAGGQSGRQIKTFSILRRKRTMSVVEFRDYWQNRHAPLVRRVPGVVRYVHQCDPLA